MPFQPLPQPGLAIFPQYVSSGPQTFKVKGDVFSSDSTITHMDGRPFLIMESELMSLSRRKTIRDAGTGQKICQIRRDGIGGDYFAETPDGRKLFDVDKDSMGTSRFAVRFENASAGGRGERCEYQSDSHWNPKDGTLSWQGRPVARMEKNGAFSSSWVVSVAPGMDPFIVIGLHIAVQDKRRTRRSAAGAAGGAGGGGGA